MGLPTPEDNSQAYRISDVTSKAEKLRNKKLLIVHGTAGKRAIQATREKWIILPIKKLYTPINRIFSQLF